MSNKKTLVLGASLNSERYSNKALHKLYSNSIETKAFGLNGISIQLMQRDIRISFRI